MKRCAFYPTEHVSYEKQQIEALRSIAQSLCVIANCLMFGAGVLSKDDITTGEQQ